MGRGTLGVEMRQRSVYFNAAALDEALARYKAGGGLGSVNQFMNGLVMDWLEGEWEKDRLDAEREKNLGSGW